MEAASKNGNLHSISEIEINKKWVTLNGNTISKNNNLLSISEIKINKK